MWCEKRSCRVAWMTCGWVLMSAIEFIGDTLTMMMGFVQGRRSIYHLPMQGDPLMSERDDKWGIWVLWLWVNAPRRDWPQKDSGVNWIRELEGRGIDELSLSRSKKRHKERVQLQLVQRWWKSYNVQRYVPDNGLEMKTIRDATGVCSLKKKEKYKLI